MFVITGNKKKWQKLCLLQNSFHLLGENHRYIYFDFLKKNGFKKLYNFYNFNVKNRFQVFDF